MSYIAPIPIVFIACGTVWEQVIIQKF